MAEYPHKVDLLEKFTPRCPWADWGEITPISLLAERIHPVEGLIKIEKIYLVQFKSNFERQKL